MVDLVAYDSAGRLIHGLIDLTGGRIADTLAAGGIIVARAVTIRDLGRERTERHDEMLLDTRRLRVVLGTDPRGSLLRRVPVLAVPVTVHVDRYVVHGMLHAPTPRNPVREAAVRPWLALTDAILEHQPGRATLRERYEVLLVNRTRAHAIVPTDARTHEARWIAASDPVTLADPGRFGRVARRA
jgi:hypothetical protein